MKAKKSAAVQLLMIGALSVATWCGFSGRAEEWPAYRGPQHNGESAEKIQKHWPDQGPRVIWRRPSVGGFSSFAVGGGRAFTQVNRDYQRIPFEHCVAVDAGTGEELWAKRFGIVKYGHDGGNAGAAGNAGGDGPRSTPALDGERLYVMTSDLELFCLEAATGDEVWSRDLIKQHEGRQIKWKNAASPVIEGDLIFVGGGGAGQALMAIHKVTGDVVWKTGSDQITHATPVVATIHGVRQVIFFTEEGLVGLEVAEGTELWRYPFRFNVSTAASPVVAGDRVYCSAGYGVGAGLVEIVKGKGGLKAVEVWRKRGELENHWSTPVYKDGHLYGMFSFKKYGTGPIKCVRLSDGAIQWEKEGYGPGNVILVDGDVLALADDGQLVMVEGRPDEYRELSRAEVLSGKCWSTPVVADGKIYVRSTEEAVCLDVTPKAVRR